MIAAVAMPSVTKSRSVPPKRRMPFVSPFSRLSYPLLKRGCPLGMWGRVSNSDLKFELIWRWAEEWTDGGDIGNPELWPPSYSQSGAHA
jgi:hypothetical protein